MAVKIKELNIKKDELEKVKFGGAWTVAGTTKLDGKIKVELSEGIVTGSGEIDVFEVSEKLRDKLYDVLSEIEVELSGEETRTTSHETESDEFQQLEEALENAGKLFESVINVNAMSSKNAQSIRDEIRKGLKDKGINLL